ncbi:hypothetical protein F5Y05DRAFT_225568 [Hypoxylon sp. FL0543]|nr:hypothetical protein F5Y05DRAFT_225568 [Hypoxylon sp. FL0543]
MHTSSLFVAAIVAAASVASAQPENRPKIYFPRHVKRQYTNHTITSSASQSTKSDLADPTTHSSTKKDSISDLLSSLLGGIDTSETTTVTSSLSSSSTSQSASPTSSPSTSNSESESESTGSSTTDGSVGTTGGVPPLIVLPTLSLDVPSLLPTSESGTASVSANKTASATGATTATTGATQETATGTGTGTVIQASTTTDSANGTAIASATESATEPTSVVSSSSGILIAPTGVVSQSPTSSDGGLIGGVTSLVGGVTSAVGGVTSAVLPTPTANATEPSSGSSAGVSSGTSTDTDSGLLPTLLPSSLSLFPTTSFPGTAPTASASGSASASTSSSDSVILSLPPLLGTGSSTASIPTSIANATDSTGLPTQSGSSSVPLTTTTGVPTNGTASTDTTSVPTITSPPVPQNTTASATELPTTESSSYVTVPLNSTVPSTSSAEPTTVEPTSVEPTTVFSTTSTPTTSSSSTSAPGVTSIPPIGTITNSESWLPTTIIIQPSTSTISTGGQPTATGIPTSLPKAITPWTEPPEQPKDTTLIQISFLYGENYQHLVDQPLAASQMFNLLPQGLAYGGGFETERVVMYNIRPYDTIARLGYITSQAMVWYPTEGISKLSDDIGYPTTPLYNHPDPLVRNLTSQINPAIGIMPGSVLGGAAGSDGNNGADPTDSGPTNNDPFDTQGPGEQTTSAQQGMTAGIAVGAASVAGAYGAAMFIIARRYKRKKQRHQRSSSINSPSDMRQTGSPALMGGALLSRDFTSNPGYGGATGNTRDSQGSGRSGMNSSARTANISAPVAAENSLGWN